MDRTLTVNISLRKITTDAPNSQSSIHEVGPKGILGPCYERLYLVYLLDMFDGNHQLWNGRASFRLASPNSSFQLLSNSAGSLSERHSYQTRGQAGFQMVLYVAIQKTRF